MNEEDLPFLNKGEIVIKSVKDSKWENPPVEFGLEVGKQPDGFGTLLLDGNWYLTNHRLIFVTGEAAWYDKLSAQGVAREGGIKDIPASSIKSIEAVAGWGWGSKGTLKIHTNSPSVNNPMKGWLEDKDQKEWDGYFENKYSKERIATTLLECGKMIAKKDFEAAIICSEQAGVDATKYKKKYANYCEEIMDINRAIKIYEELKEDAEVVRLRTFIKEEAKIKVTQKVVHGDEVTAIKDSVVSKSNIGSGGSKSKGEELREAKALLDDGIIDDDEFKEMKKEILGK